MRNQSQPLRKNALGFSFKLQGFFFFEFSTYPLRTASVAHTSIKGETDAQGHGRTADRRD